MDRRRRSSSCERSSSSTPTFARAHVALGKALLADGKVADGGQALQEAARLEPDQRRGALSARPGAGARRAQGGRRRRAREGPRARCGRRSQTECGLDIAEGRAALERGELDARRQKFRRAVQLQPESAEAQRYLDRVLEEQRKPTKPSPPTRKRSSSTRHRRSRKRASRIARSAAGADDPARIAEVEGYIREGKFADAEPLLAAYVKERPASSWGWYALGYSLFAQQKIGESIKALAKSLELDVTNAEAHKILGRDLMIIGRFDAAQIEFEQGIRYKPDSAEMPLQPRQAVLDPGQLGAGAQGVRGGAAHRPRATSRRSTRSGFALEALGDDEGAVANYQKAVALNDERHGTFAPPHVNLSAYYNRTGDPGQGARARAQGASRSIRSPTAPGFRRAGPTSGRAASTTPCTALNARHRPQPARILVLLRPRRRLPSARLDGREPKGARVVHAARARSARARREAAPRRRTPRQPRASVTERPSHRGADPGARFCRRWAAPAPAISRRLASAALAGTPRDPVVFTDVTAAAGLLARA